MNDAGTRRLGRRPALDGLRGVAVLLVVVHHMRLLGERSSAGPIGVTVFFALSGFLITTLLVREREMTGRTNLLGFYLRRARRLLPALLFFLMIAGGLGWVTWGDSRWTLGYVANLRLAAGHSLAGLSHTWSLALEEQFYLLWPVVLAVLHRRWGRTGVACGAGIGAGVSVLARVTLWAAGASDAHLYFGPVVRADALLLGCLAAVVTVPRVVPGWAALLIVLGLVASPWTVQLVALPTVVAVLVVAVIADSPRMLSMAALRYVGRRSYALYLWHFPLIFVWAPGLPYSRGTSVALAVLIAWGLAEVSWWTVERPSAHFVHHKFRRIGRASEHIEVRTAGLPGR